MPERYAHLVLLLLFFTAATPVAGQPAAAFVCRGHSPEWNLRIAGSAATLATLEAGGLTQTALEGHLQETGGRPPFFVYRGRAATSGIDLVAVITPEACVDTMAEAREGGGPLEYTARVSLPDGGTRLGCCMIAPIAPPTPPPSESAPSAPPVVVPPPAEPPAAQPPPAPTSSALPAAGGEIIALALPDGRTCRSTAKRATATFQGQRVKFDCGRWSGDTVGLVGPLTVDREGLLAAQKAVIEWGENLGAPSKVEPTAARASEIALLDGLTCRLAGTGATLAFEGRRASYTCGMKDGDTVALLGDLEPAEGGFRITRARVAHDAGGFSLRSSESILITAPGDPTTHAGRRR